MVAHAAALRYKVRVPGERALLDADPPSLLAALGRVSAAIVPIVLVAYAGAAAVRYGLIEREDLGALCLSEPTLWWCAVRLAIVRAFLGGVFGYGSVAAALLGLARRSAPLSATAIAIGTSGIVLYDFAWSGLGLLIGILVLTRRAYERG